MGTNKDYLLGRIAVEKGLITEQQLSECVGLQQGLPTDPNQTIGRAPKEPRPLGVVLLSRGLIKEQQLIELIEEQNRRMKLIEEHQRHQRIDSLFGELLVKSGRATQNQINKCLELQQQMAEKGATDIPRLGEMLVEHGFIDKKTVQEMLKQQNKDVLFCTGCGRQFNVVGVEQGKTYKCKVCNGIMITRSMLDSLKADETHFGFEIGGAGPPPAPKN